MQKTQEDTAQAKAQAEVAMAAARTVENEGAANTKSEEEAHEEANQMAAGDVERLRRLHCRRGIPPFAAPKLVRESMADTHNTSSSNACPRAMGICQVDAAAGNFPHEFRMTGHAVDKAALCFNVGLNSSSKWKGQPTADLHGYMP